jgi:hypothetical protein
MATAAVPVCYAPVSAIPPQTAELVRRAAARHLIPPRAGFKHLGDPALRTLAPRTGFVGIIGTNSITLRKVLITENHISLYLPCTPVNKGH